VALSDLRGSEHQAGAIDNYVQAGALAHKNPIEAFDGSFEYVMTDMDWSQFTLPSGLKVIRWNLISSRGM
jgi:hypothetical protein